MRTVSMEYRIEQQFKVLIVINRLRSNARQILQKKIENKFLIHHAIISVIVTSCV